MESKCAMFMGFFYSLLEVIEMTETKEEISQEISIAEGHQIHAKTETIGIIGIPEIIGIPAIIGILEIIGIPEIFEKNQDVR